MKALLPLGLILAVFTALAVSMMKMTPYREAGVLVYQGGAGAADIGAPDERQHANYVMRLMRGEGFAVLNPKDPNLYENYQAHQPPLYYVLAAGWSKIFGADLTTESGGTKLRVLSILFGLAGVIGLFFAGRWGLGSDGAGFVVAAFSLMPMYLGLCSAINNDPLLISICTWAIALMLHGIRRGFTTKSAVIVGILVGLAILTKTTGLALIPAMVLALYMSQRKSERTQLSPFISTLGLSVLIPLPWWIRNMNLYGDPLAMSAFQQSFVDSPKADMFIQQFGSNSYWFEWVMWWTARSFVGVFGYMDIFLKDPGTDRLASSDAFYVQVLTVLLIVSIAGLVIGLFTKRVPELPARDAEEEEDAERVKESFAPTFVLTGVFFLVIIFLFVQFNKTYFQGQARYLYPAFVFPALCMGYALYKLMGRFGNWAFLIPLLLLGYLDYYAINYISWAFQIRTAI